MAPHAETAASFTSQDAVYPGLGRCKRWTIDVPPSEEGTAVSVEARSGALDLVLRLETEERGIFLGEDDDAGGGTSPFVDVVVTRPGPEGLRIAAIVATKSVDATGEFVVRVARREDDPTTSAVAREIEERTRDRKRSPRDDADAAYARRSADLRRGAEALAVGPSRRLERALTEILMEESTAAEPIARREAAAALVRARSAWAPADDPMLLSRRFAYAAALHDCGDYAEACREHETILASCARSPAAEASFGRSTRSNYAATFSALGDHRAALRLEEALLREAERTETEDAPPVRFLLRRLAVTRHFLGDRATAAALVRRALAASSREADDDPEVQAARTVLAVVLKSCGDLDEARTLEEKNLEQMSRRLSALDPRLALARQNLAATYHLFGEFAAARRLADQVLAARRATLPARHPDLLSARLATAVLAKEEGDLEAALAVEEEIVEETEGILPETHPVVAAARLGMGESFARLGDPSSARDAFARLLSARLQSLPETHPDVFVARANLVVALRGCGEDRAAGETLVAALRGVRASAESFEFGSTPAERRSGSTFVENALTAGLSYLDGAAPEDRAAALEEILTLADLRRGVEGGASRGGARTGEDGARLDDLRRERYAAAAEVARRSRSGSDSDGLRTAVARRRDAEERLRAASASLGGTGVRAATRAEIAGALRSGEAAVLLVRHRRFAVTKAAPRPTAAGDRYVALVVVADGALSVADLGAAEAIDKSVTEWRAAATASADRGVDPPAASDRLGSANGALDAAVLRPILAATGGAKTLFVAADDALHLVPLAVVAEMRPQGASDLSIVAVPRLAALRRRAESRPSGPPTLLVVGGVDYDAAASRPRRGAASEGAPSSPGLGGRTEPPPSARPSFAPLPRTAEEADAIAFHFVRAFPEAPKPLFLRDADATREAFVASAPSARYVHLATHGYFAPDSVPSWRDERPVDAKLGVGRFATLREEAIGRAPMSLCGAAFAGANAGASADGSTDGVLTAEEIAALDLRGCDLCVLSACETNAGVRRNGQAIQSLQTALHAAGARASITTLWRVSDDAAKDLMTEFYRRLWRLGESKAAALRAAQRKVRDATDPSTGSARHAFRDWAGWVLAGDPE